MPRDMCVGNTLPGETYIITVTLVPCTVQFSTCGNDGDGPSSLLNKMIGIGSLILVCKPSFSVLCGMVIDDCRNEILSLVVLFITGAKAEDTLHSEG